MGSPQYAPAPAADDLNSQPELSAPRSPGMSAMRLIVLHPYTKCEVRRPSRSEDSADFRSWRLERRGDLDLWPLRSPRILVMRYELSTRSLLTFKWWRVARQFLRRRRRRIFISPKASNYIANIISKHRGGFPEGQTPIVLDTLSKCWI